MDTGKVPQSYRLLVRGERISVISLMTVNGILDLKVVHSTANGDVFLEFVEKDLLPCLMPYNGSNPKSIVILDNCSIHHVADLINSVASMVHYLPPYSPDYNPIEWCFSKVKGVIPSLEKEMQLANDIELIIRMAFATGRRKIARTGLRAVEYMTESDCSYQLYTMYCVVTTIL